MPTLLSHQLSSSSVAVDNDSAIEMASCSPQAAVTFSPNYRKSLLHIVLLIGLFAALVHNSYDGLGRRIRTTSGSDTINYYYDPEVEHRQLGSCGVNLPQVNPEGRDEWARASSFLELGHSVNGSLSWNLYGPDRTGTYGRAQGIGGLECTYDEGAGITCDHVKNFFGDTVGVYTDTQAAVYPSVLGGYGPMPGSSVNGNLQPQWRGHYLDPTGFVSMGARYYDPQAGRFISPDPLGHSSSLNLYDYCNGDPVNGLDPDGRCVEGGVKGYTMGGFAEYDNTTQSVAGFVGTVGSYVTPGLGEYALVRDVGAALWSGAQAVGDMYNNGLNWANGTKLGLSALGAGLGGSAIVGPVERAVARDIGTVSGGTTTLWRAVGPAELNDINATATLRNLGSAEGKYFTTSAEGASSYAKQAVKGFGDPPYTLIKTQAPNSIFNGLHPATVDSGIHAWVIPNNKLSGLIPNVLKTMPIP
jgi:RHS repeat-associated protein